MYDRHGSQAYLGRGVRGGSKAVLWYDLAFSMRGLCVERYTWVN
jgi:hypothetical protein